MVVAWENLQWGFCDVGCCSSIIAVFVMLFFIHCLSTSFLTLPWAIVRFLHPFCTFRPAHCRVICDNFILTFWILLLQFCRERYGFEWVFLPTGVFYLTLLPKISATTCFYQGLSESWQFFLEVCRASCWSSKHRPGPSVCLNHSNRQKRYDGRFYLF